MSDKALELGTAQVADLQEALQEQGENLETSEAAKDALKASKHVSAAASQAATRTVCAFNRQA